MVGTWIKVGGAVYSSGATLAGPWVEGMVLGCAGLGVEAEVLIVLLVWVSSSTLRLATQGLCK